MEGIGSSFNLIFSGPPKEATTAALIEESERRLNGTTTRDSMHSLALKL